MRKECPVCKSRCRTVLKKIRLAIPSYFHLPDEYDVVACNDCGFCYAATEATLEDYNYYYSFCNAYSGMPDESKGKTELNRRAAGLVKALIKEDRELLDMGFGKGNLMRLLKAKGFCNVCGIDPSEESVVSMREEGFTAYKGNIFDGISDALKGRFDCIFLFDVLEHLLYPDTAIERLGGYLRENGYLIISVPNYAWLSEDDSILANQFNQEHINYFSPVSLDNLLGKHGFYRSDDESIKKLQMTDGAELLMVYRCPDKNKVSGVAFTKDEFCQKSIMDYIKRNDELEQSVNSRLASFREHGNPVYVWGTGAYVMWLLSNTALEGMNIEAFIDNNPAKVGRELVGKQIISAGQIKADIPILICAMRYSQQIVNQIEQIHLSNMYLII